MIAPQYKEEEAPSRLCIAIANANTEQKYQWWLFVTDDTDKRDAIVEMHTIYQDSPTSAWERRVARQSLKSVNSLVCCVDLAGCKMSASELDEVLKGREQSRGPGMFRSCFCPSID